MNLQQFSPSCCPPARLPACPPARLPACPPARLPACLPGRLLCLHFNFISNVQHTFYPLKFTFHDNNIIS
jgi:hypothetical protein